MTLRPGAPFTALGKGTGIVIEEEPLVDISTTGVGVNEVLKNQINQSLIEGLRKDLGYEVGAPEWVDLRVTLNRYAVRMENAFLFFPVVLNFLRALAHKGCRNCLIIFLELADQMPMDRTGLEIFVGKLLTLDLNDPLKSPVAVLISLQKIEPDNWREAIWYMDLIIEVDLTIAEVAAMYLEQMANRPPLYTFFVLQVARIGRMEAVDRFVELLPLVEKNGDDIGAEMKPIMDLICEGRLAEAEMTMVALGQMYGGKVGGTAWRDSIS